MGRMHANQVNWAVSVLCALALVLLSSAHRPLAVVSPASDPAIAAYLSVGGSLAELCLSADGGDEKAAHGDCPACVLAKIMVLGPCVAGASGPDVLASAFLTLPAFPLLSGHGPRAPPARGPPSIQLI